MLSVCAGVYVQEAALLAVDLPEHLLSARQKRDNAHTMKMAVLFKLRDEFKSMTAAWKTALSTVADEIAQVRGADRMLMLVYR
jgi:hypothetical protein